MTRPAESAHLRVHTLAALLDRGGVTDFYDSLDPWGEMLGTAPSLWRRLDLRQQQLVSLLALGQSLPAAALADPLTGAVADGLVELGVAHCGDEGIDLNGLALYRYGGCWLFADRPSPSPTLYFGADSVALASRIAPLRGGRGLDLCSGPGIQALVMASRGLDVDAVEINPVACKLFELNAHLNGLDDRARVSCGNLYEAAGVREGYDLIVANPPLLPIPAGLPYPFIGDGGETGLDIALRVLISAASRLSDAGTVQIICAARMRGLDLADLALVRDMASNAGLDVLVTIIQTYAVTPDSLWVHGVAATSIDHVGDPTVTREECAESLSSLYIAGGATGICSLTFRAWLGTGVVRVQDFSDPDDPSPNPWLIL